MNTKQRSTWWELVHQCEIQCARRPYSSINVASRVRSDAIVAADALVELVTPELAALLEQLTDMAVQIALETEAHYGIDHPLAIRRNKRIENARALAVRIREALALEANDED